MTNQTRTSMMNRLMKLIDDLPDGSRRNKLRAIFMSLAYGAGLPMINRALKGERFKAVDWRHRIYRSVPRRTSWRCDNRTEVFHRLSDGVDTRKPANPLCARLIFDLDVPAGGTNIPPAGYFSDSIRTRVGV